jgi:photosystem II stability/assembly factor-like uncharacterized protein
MNKATIRALYEVPRLTGEDNEVRRYPLNDLSFASEAVGWAVGSAQVLHTRDGGATWVNLFEPGPRQLGLAPWSVRAADPAACWVLGLLSAGDLYCAYTRDAGQNWHARPFRPNFFPNDVYSADANRAWVVGDDGHYHSRARSLLITDDGGDSWQEVELGLEGRPGRVAFPAGGGRGWLLENRLRADGDGITTSLHVSDDGGLRWREAARFGREVSDLCVLDAETLYVGGEAGFVAASTDGGRTWERLRTRCRGFINSVSFYDRLWGLALSDFGVALLTEDGGETWQRLSGVKKSENFVGAVFTSTSRAIVASNRNIYSLQCDSSVSESVSE